MGSKTSKLETVRRLLAKAESTTPEEAEALTEAAMKLMARHGIDDAMLAALAAEDRSAPKEEFVRESYFFPSTYAKGLTQMALRVTLALKTVKMFVNVDAWQDGKKGERIWVFGYASDVERAVMLIASLHQQADAAQRAWWRTAPEREWMSRQDAWKERRAFYVYFGTGVEEKLREIYREAEAETTASSGTSTELVLRDRAAEVESEYKARFALKKGRGMAGGWGTSAAAGREAGRNANVGLKAVSA